MKGHNSQPVTENMIHEVVEFLLKYPDLIAIAKESAEKAELHTELILAHLTLRAEGKSHSERESRAKIQPEYKEAKTREITARAEELGIKARFAANELVSSLYQTLSANARSTKI